MPIAIKNPRDLLAQIRRQSKPKAPSKSDISRLHALASDNIEPILDADFPDVGGNVPGLLQVNPVLAISEANASWFARHGGSLALNRALNAYRASQRSRRNRRSTVAH